MKRRPASSLRLLSGNGTINKHLITYVFNLKIYVENFGNAPFCRIPTVLKSIDANSPIRANIRMENLSPKISFKPALGEIFRSLKLELPSASFVWGSFRSVKKSPNFVDVFGLGDN